MIRRCVTQIGRREALFAAAGGAVAIGLVVAAAVVMRDEPAPPSGDLIAYSCKEPGNAWYAICVMRSDGTENERLTTRLTTTEPAWSSDGRRIAFTRNEDVGEYTTFTDDDVFVMDADGGDPQQLTPEQEGSSSGQPTWSADGREIAFVRGPSVATTTPSRFGDLLVMRADGSDARRLIRGPASGPAWSPDGREIAFTRGDHLNTTRANMDLYVVGLSGGAPRRLTRTPRTFETAPAWSPDGTRIAFARSTFRTQFDGKAAIYVMNRDGTGEKLVLAHRHFAPTPSNLAWSPDGRTIVFETSLGVDCIAIALVALDGGLLRRLTTCSGPSRVALGPRVATGRPLSGCRQRFN